MSHGADVGALDSSGYTPLHTAATVGSEACVLALLDGDASTFVKNDLRETPAATADRCF